MINKVGNSNSLSFKSVCGRYFQAYTENQYKLIDSLEAEFKKPLKKNSNKTYLQELEKKNIDIYVKPAKNENEIKVSLIKRLKNNGVMRLFNFGAIDELALKDIPQKSLDKVHKNENLLKNLSITAGVFVIAGLMSLLYMLPSKNIRSQYVEKAVDTVTLVKDSLVNKIKIQ